MSAIAQSSQPAAESPEGEPPSVAAAVAAARAVPAPIGGDNPSVISWRIEAGSSKRVRNWHVWQKMLLCAVILFVPTALTVVGAVLTVFKFAGNAGLIMLIFGIISLVAGGYFTLRIVTDISATLRRLASEARDIASGQKQTLTLEPRRDELGELSEAFRRVVESSHSDRHRLTQNNNDLQAMNSQLEDANKQVQSFAYKAGEANNAKREFLAVMSHEIRTPVNGIIGMTELALQTELTASQRDYLQTINSCAESLLAQLNDVLDFSKIEAGKLELERTEFSLRELLGEALNTLAPRAHAKGLELLLHIRPEVPDSLVGDPHRLRQIVVNLVGNALKFTEKGDVLVRVENSKWIDGDAELAFAIADTGIGIPADRISGIFQPFSQADYSTTRRFGGTGLGLAITQQLVGLMRGAIKVESELGRGSVFRFSARFGYQKVSVDHDYTIENYRNLRVMILEPHTISLRIVTEMLSTWHIKAEIARDVVTAVKQLRGAVQDGKPYDLFIGDAVRPDSPGLKVASTIGSYSELSATRVMLLTSTPSRQESERFGGPVRATLVKPVTTRSLRGALAKAMETEKKATMAMPKGGSVPPQRPLNVLVAEDNAVNQRLAKLNLEGWGHTVTVAGDGQEAVEAYEKTEFDLILMDLQMPRLSGFEASAEIRKQEKASSRPRTPILALSANVLKGVRDECAKSGMDGYVSKPVRQQELVGAMALVIPSLFSDPAAAAAYLQSGEKTTQPAGATSALFTAPAAPAPVAKLVMTSSGIKLPAAPAPEAPAAPAPEAPAPSESKGIQKPAVPATPASPKVEVEPTPILSIPPAAPVVPVSPEPAPNPTPVSTPEEPTSLRLAPAPEPATPSSKPAPTPEPAPVASATPEATAPADAPREATFDAEMLMDNIGGDKAMLAEVVRLCRNNDAPRLLKELADSLATGNCATAAKAAHGLKGMVGAFNATTAYRLAKHLEINAKEERLEVLLAEADEFVTSLRALLVDLENLAEIEHAFLEWI